MYAFPTSVSLGSRTLPLGTEEEEEEEEEGLYLRTETRKRVQTRRRRRSCSLIVAKNDLKRHARTLSGDATGLPPQARKAQRAPPTHGASPIDAHDTPTQPSSAFMREEGSREKRAVLSSL